MALTYNSVSSVPVNTETNVLTYTPGANIGVKGFIATGTAAGKFVLRIGGATATAGAITTSYRTSADDRTAYVVFPDVAVTASTNVYVNVINEEFDGAKDYEATLIYA